MLYDTIISDKTDKTVRPARIRQDIILDKTRINK